MRGRRSAARTVPLAVVLVAAGCAVVQPARPIPPECEFPDDVRLAFAGETTMTALGIPFPDGHSESFYAWVTAEPITVGATGEPQRWACVETGFRTFERSVYPGALQGRPTPRP